MTVSDVQVVPIEDPAADDLIIKAFGREPILIQLPTVFALFAPATQSGATLLDSCKQRLPGKHYGFIVGDPRAFLALAPKEPLTRFLLSKPDDTRLAPFCRDMHGTFVRLQVAGERQSSTVICQGRLQGLLFGGVLAEKMRLMENLSRSMPGKLLGAEYQHYAAPIGSSCNMSGDPDGSITDLDRALEFARARGVQLCLTLKEGRAGGSQPILSLSQQRIETIRKGPGGDEKQALLQGWLDQALEAQRLGSLV